MPSISVIIPTYNRAWLINRAVASAIAATVPGDEIIVVDDGSTDETEEVLKPFTNSIQYIRVANGGAGSARNVGLRKARNKLIAFLDSDDEWMPDKLKLQRAFMEARPDVLLCFSNFMVREVDGSEHSHFLEHWMQWFEDPRSWEEIFELTDWYSSFAQLPSSRADFRVFIGNIYPSLLRTPHILTDTVVIRRNSNTDEIFFAQDLRLYEDWEFFARIARMGLAAYLDCDTVWNYGHTGPRLTNADALIAVDTRFKLTERLWGKDQIFLEKYAYFYLQIISSLHLARVKALLVHGQTANAHKELQNITGCPIPYRLLALLPGMVTKTFLDIRRKIIELRK